MSSLQSSLRLRGGLWWAAISLVLLGSAPGPVQAGGPLGFTSDGKPFAMDWSQPIRYAIDLGSLGSRSRARTVQLVERAVQAWQNVPTARLEFEPAGNLRQDITGRNVMSFLNGLRDGDPHPILLDSDGSIIDTLRGEGASRSVLGSTSPFADERTGRIALSMVVLVAPLHERFSDDFLYSTAVHELGHAIGLDHSQCNVEQMFDGDSTNDHLAPVMSYARGPNEKGDLSLDDQVWVSWLYPSADFASRTGTIRGRVLLPDGVTGLAGIGVIARRSDDPQFTAVSAVSGYQFQGNYGGVPDPARLGEFLIPGLPPGSYTLELHELGESDGQVRVPHAYLVGGRKFWREGSSAQDRATDFTPIVVNAGQTVSGIDVILNGEDLGAPRQVTEIEPNELPNGQRVTLPAVIEGEVEDSAGDAAGPPIDSEDDLHDVYRVALREPTIVTAILSSPQRGTDLDLYVLGVDGGDVYIGATSIARGTPPETIQLRLPAGVFYFGVHRASGRGSPYTLRLLASPAPDPDPLPQPAFITYLLIGDITETSAIARWQTTGSVPSVVQYNQPLREVGSTVQEREHSITLTDMKPGTRTGVEVFAQSPGGLDLIDATLTTASPSSTNGESRIVTGSSVIPYFEDLVLAQVRITNAGDGEALQVRIEQLTLATGWELTPSTRLPETLDVGKIGAGGSGMLSVWIYRRSGTTAPRLTVNGTYTEAAGGTYRF